jgi:clan AA aspartic protease (TIGR02281 family)
MQQAARRRRSKDAEASLAAEQMSAKLAEISKEQAALNAQCSLLEKPLQNDAEHLNGLAAEMSRLAQNYNSKSLSGPERAVIWNRYEVLRKERDPLLQQTQKKETEYRDVYSRLTSLHSQYYELTRTLKSARVEMSGHSELVRYQNEWSDFQSELKRCEALEPRTQYETALARFSAAAQSLDANVRRDLVAASRLGGVFQTKVVVNGSLVATLVVDTGASQTSISRKFAEQLNLGSLDDAPTQSFRLADGRAGSAPVVRLASVQVGSVMRTNVMAMVMDEAPGTDVDGLLGMNFLENFVVRMDSDKNELELISCQE